MQPPRSSGAARKTKAVNERALSSPPPLSAQARLTRLTDDLAIAADWKRDFQARSARAQLVLETIGLSTERHDALLAEGRALIRVCDALARQMPGQLANDGEKGAT
jgi:hypothetical protein